MTAKKPSKGTRPSKDATKAKAKAKAKPIEGKTQEPKPHGGQTTYTREIADEVCRLMSEGKTLNRIASMPGMPPRSTVLGWKKADIDGFADRYAHAREDLLEYWEDETVDVADDGRNDYYEKTTKDGDTITAFNKENVERSKLRVETRKWMLAKLNNKRFGDKVEQTHKGGEAFLSLFQMMTAGAPSKK